MKSSQMRLSSGERGGNCLGHLLILTRHSHRKETEKASSIRQAQVFENLHFACRSNFAFQFATPASLSIVMHPPSPLRLRRDKGWMRRPWKNSEIFNILQSHNKLTVINSKELAQVAIICS
jgi:hypothetical protein